jgi:hypothetical protein
LKCPFVRRDRLLIKEVGNMRRAMDMLDIKAQLLIAAILVSATGAWSAETANQVAPAAAPAATEVAIPKADAGKKPDARKPQRIDIADQTSAPVEPPAAVDLAVSKTESGKTESGRKPEAKKPHTASNGHCGWGLFSWFHSCSSGRVGLVLGTAY